MRKATPLVVAGAVVGAVLAGGPARAATESVTCAGTEVVGYSPGLLLTQQSVQGQVTGNLAACTSTDPNVTAGNYGEEFTTSLSCLTLFAGRSGQRVFHWSGKQTSTFAFTRLFNNVAGQTTVTFTGNITAGLFAGATVVQQVVFITPNVLQCLASPGLTGLGPGVVALNITKA